MIVESSTGTTMPTPSVHPDIFGRVLVSFGAMGFCRVSGVEGVPPEKVFPTRNRLQVIGVHAVADAAQVIELKSSRDGANQEFIRNSVSIELPPTHAALADFAVLRTFIDGALKKPARIGEGDSFDQSVEQWHSGILTGHRATSIAGVIGPDVCASRPSPNCTRGGG